MYIMVTRQNVHLGELAPSEGGSLNSSFPFPALPCSSDDSKSSLGVVAMTTENIVHRGDRGTWHTGEHGTQGNMAHRRTWHTGEHGTQGNMAHRGTWHTGEHGTQENMAHRGTWHTGEHGTQGNMAHRGSSHNSAWEVVCQVLDCSF